MSVARHKSIRIRAEVQRVIDLEITRSHDTCDETEAISRLILRASEKPEPVYLVAQTCHREGLEFFARDLMHLLDDLERVRARLGGPLQPIRNDPERTANIALWRDLSEQLPGRLERMVDRAEGLVQQLTGISQGEAKLLGLWHLNLVRSIERDNHDLHAASAANDAVTMRKITARLPMSQALLALLMRLGIPVSSVKSTVDQTKPPTPPAL